MQVQVQPAPQFASRVPFVPRAQHCHGATHALAFVTIAQTEYWSQIDSQALKSVRFAVRRLFYTYNTIHVPCNYSCSPSTELTLLPDLPKRQLEERLHSRERIEDILSRRRDDRC